MNIVGESLVYLVRKHKVELLTLSELRNPFNFSSRLGAGVRANTILFTMLTAVKNPPPPPPSPELTACAAEPVLLTCKSSPSCPVPEFQGRPCTRGIVSPSHLQGL